MANNYRILIFTAACYLLFCLSGCYTKEIQNTDLPESNPAAMANPAVEKCKNEGYILEPILTNGVPTGYFCVNPSDGQRCEAWKYFRGECKIIKK